MNAHPLNCLATALLGSMVLVGLASPARGQTISNPSFEGTPAFTVFPGYISGNTAIPGWTANDNSRVGINLTGTASPFVNNGALPAGTNAAFLQSGAVGGTTLSTVIADLTPGTVYRVNFRCNARTNASTALSTPALKVSIDGTPIVDAALLSVATAVNTAGWRFYAFDFTATAATATLTLKNDTAGDTTALVDDFTIAVSSGSWSIASWSSDATSGVDSSRVYTHAYNFNSASSPSINGVTFTGTGAGTVNPSAATRFSSTFPALTTDTANTLITSGGGSAQLAAAFCYNGNPEVLNLFGLVPGAEYVTTFYSVGWTETIRPVMFSVGTDRFTVNQDHYGTDNGIRVSYRYIAPASGTLVINITPMIPVPATTFHCYGFSNYELSTQPVVALQSRNATGAIGNTNYFRATAAGTRPLSFQWLKDGSPLTDQTNGVLVVPVLTGTETGNYSVVVTNLVGTNTSATRSLTLGPIANPSFEADILYGFPGYSGVSAPNPVGFPLSGWTTSNTNRTGLNPIADGQSPFANNGIIPDGTQVAFIQSGNPGPNSLTTVLQGLTPMTTYTVRMRVNSRNAQKPKLTVGVDNRPILDTYHNSVGGTNEYRRFSFDFTAAGTSAVLGLTNDIAIGDHTLLIDNLSIAVSTSKWSFAIWTNDATAGIDTSKLYTHAYHFGGVVTDTNINGVTFRGASGVNPSVPGFFSTAGFPSAFAGDSNVFNVTLGGSAGISSTFIYGGATQSVTMNGLLPGTEYVASIYSVAFDIKTYGRAATFNAGGDTMTINQDHFDLDNGIVVSYRYIAPPSGSFTLTWVPTDSASTIHTYGFANRVALDSPPVIGVQPAPAFVPAGSSTTLTVGLSAGSLPIYYQWYSNGVLLAGETNSSLALSNLSVFGTNGYSVVATNFLGSVTSVVAVVETGVALSGLYHTGVDDFLGVLPGGSVDPHYRLVSSPDPFFPGPDAVTLHNGAFPLAGNYFTNGPFSAWIAPRTNSSVGNSNGYYIYRTSFIFDSTELGRSQINGKWASDNEGIAILLNGTPTGISNMVSAAFGAFTPFTISNGFLAGSNVIDFVISNGPATGPTGLRVELQGVGRPLPPTAPVLLSQPSNQSTPLGGNAQFTAVGYGSGPLSYQWYYFGFLLPDQTNRFLRLQNVAFDQDGDYTVIVTNSSGSVTSVMAHLTVVLPPSIFSEPSSQLVECGGTATFSVGVDGTEPYTYQWYRNGSPLPGANAATLTVNNVQAAQLGDYTVAVTNSAGGVVSVPAQLTLVDTTPPTIACPANVIATVDPGLCTASGVILGTPMVSDLCSVASVTSNAPAVFQSGVNLVTWTVTDGGGNQTSCTQLVTVVDLLVPTITLSPADRTNTTGTTAMFAAAATSCVPPAYQWLFGMTPIPNATNAVLTLPNVQDANAGGYAVVVSNAAGSVTSTVAVLTINHPPTAGDNGAATTQNTAVSIALIKLLANDTDSDGDTLTVTGAGPLSTNGGTVSLSATHVTYTPVSGFNGIDRFNYTVSDGRGGSTTGVVEILVTTGSLPSANMVSLATVPGGYLIRFAGIPGFSYEIQRAPSVTGPWTVISTQVAPLHGIIDYIDTAAPPGNAFYRTAVATP